MDGTDVTRLESPRRLDHVVPDRPWPRHRQRPSGDVAALDRPIYGSGRVYLAVTAVVIGMWMGAAVVPGLAEAIDAVDHAVLRALESIRIRPVVATASDLQILDDDRTWLLLRWATIAAGLAFRRVRHVVVFVGLLLVMTAATTAAAELVERGPVTDVAVIGVADSPAFPSRPVVDLGLALVGAMYVLVPRGRLRIRAKLMAAATMMPFALSRSYLALDRPSDIIVGLVLGMAIPVVAFRYLVPNESFPITYRRDRQPRLTSSQLAAIRSGLARQLHWDLRDVYALRPPGSAGSTPLLLELVPGDAGAPAAVFAKLYSITHLRSDRWYKLARAIRFGRLEDESPFSSVRQLVEHEDYLLRLAGSQGLPVPRSYGIIELSRGRDYLLLLELLPDTRQLATTQATTALVDQGLQLVADLWEAGVAHRDIKPANLVVSDGRLYLVDLSFAEVAPTPWRQAVDLGNMMLCLGLVADPEHVLERALRWFTPVEIAEAFAAISASVTVPAQLRRLIRERAPDLPDRFRRMLPPRPAIGIQRWSASRVALTAAAVGGVLGGMALLVFNLRTVGLL
jgi:tRNA A-37 threonylcarbamoyl transferase component Bud32